MKRSRRSLLSGVALYIFAGLCLPTSAQSSAVASGRPGARVRHVFIVSIDGGKPAVMRESAMPNLFRLVREGSATWQAQTVFPSITLVAHTSMLTGVSPRRHKIDWNDWKPERGLVTVPTVFTEAHRAGLSTAMYVGKEKFRHLNTPGAVDQFGFPGYAARKVAADAVRGIVSRKPHLSFIHFADPDGAGHAHGWGSDAQKKAFAETDQALGLLLEGIRKAGIQEESVLIISADHGGHDRTHGSASPEDMTIPWIVWGKGVAAGKTLATPINTCDTAATALWLLGLPVPPDWEGRPVVEAFSAGRTLRSQHRNR